MLKFKLFNTIPVAITPAFWVFSVLLAWLNAETPAQAIVWVIVVLISVLVHESGHALTAKAFGQTTEIELQALGGTTRRTGLKLKLWKDFITVINGPLAGFLLSYTASLILLMNANGNMNPLIEYALRITFFVNLFWTIINLLPVMPLDGGQLLAIILKGIFKEKGAVISFFIGMILAIALALVFFILRSFFIGSIFLMIAFENYRTWKENVSNSEESIDHINDEEWKALLSEIKRDISAGYYDVALNKIDLMRTECKEGAKQLLLIILASKIYALHGQFSTVYSLLKPLQSRLKNEGLSLLHLAAFKQKKWEDVVSIGDPVYQLSPTVEVAFTNAIAHAMLGNVRSAIGWLQSTKQDKTFDLSKQLEKKEFDPIRSDPVFRDFIASIRNV